MENFKIKVLRRDKNQDQYKVYGFERINERGDFEFCLLGDPHWIFGTFSSILDNAKYKRVLYTGLMDINGREIYENDKVSAKWNRELYVYTVVMIDGCWSLVDNYEKPEQIYPLYDKLHFDFIIS